MLKDTTRLVYLKYSAVGFTCGQSIGTFRVYCGFTEGLSEVYLGFTCEKCSEGWEFMPGLPKPYRVYSQLDSG